MSFDDDTSFNNLEDKEWDNNPDFFLKSDKYPGAFKFSFWIGPKRIEQARVFKKKCNAETERYHYVFQAAQEMYPSEEREFSDEDHENFYQYCIGKKTEDEISYLFNKAAAKERIEKVEKKLEYAEKRSILYEERRKLCDDKSTTYAQLKDSNKGFGAEEDQKVLEDRIKSIDEKIASIDKDVKGLDEEVRELDSTRTKRPRRPTTGLYCAQCHHPKKGG